MPVSESGQFYLENSPKQMEIMRAVLEKGGLRKYIFVNGPKWTGKTRGCLDALVGHAWNTKNANICVVVPTISAGADSGIWTELSTKTIPRWVAGDFGLEWFTDPAKKNDKTGSKTKGTSKKLYFDITNKFDCDSCSGTGMSARKKCSVCKGTGRGISHVELDSLKDERDVETYFFNRYYTMIYWGELQNYKERHTFTTLIQGLRTEGVTNPDDFVLLCDGNPSDLGEDAWQYKVWFEERISRDLPEDQKAMQPYLKLIIVTLDDNPFLSDAEKKGIIASYASDPDLYARYILGQWKKSSSDALFAGVFKPSKHVVDIDVNGEPIELIPQSDCIKLICGWDPGGANPAMVIAEKCFKWICIGGVWREEAIFKFIDELVFVKADFSIAEFTVLALEKIKKWEAIIGRPIEWQHWSDNTAFTQTESISKRTVYEEVFAESGGVIELEASDAQFRFGKGNPMNRPGTVAQGIRLWRKMLFQERILICAHKCPKLLEMCKSLRRKPKTNADIIAENDQNRHIFDAARYLVSRECYDEVADAVSEIRNANTGTQGIISVPL